MPTSTHGRSSCARTALMRLCFLQGAHFILFNVARRRMLPHAPPPPPIMAPRQANEEAIMHDLESFGYAHQSALMARVA